MKALIYAAPAVKGLTEISPHLYIIFDFFDTSPKQVLYIIICGKCVVYCIDPLRFNNIVSEIHNTEK